MRFPSNVNDLPQMCRRAEGLLAGPLRPFCFGINALEIEGKRQPKAMLTTV